MFIFCLDGLHVVFFYYHRNRVNVWDAIFFYMSIRQNSPLLQEGFKVILLEVSCNWLIVIVCLCGKKVSHLIWFTLFLEVLHVFFILMAGSWINDDLATLFVMIFLGIVFRLNIFCFHLFVDKCKVGIGKQITVHHLRKLTWTNLFNCWSSWCAHYNDDVRILLLCKFFFAFILCLTLRSTYNRIK